MSTIGLGHGLAASRQGHCEELFAAAVTLSPELRIAFLDANCTDPSIRGEVESLLAFSSQPVQGLTQAIAHAAECLAGPDLSGSRIGPYLLTGVIGRGGMGTVYRAVRDDDQFKQTVAVKMIRFLGDNPDTLERFLRERQILASLEHPNIARLLDGGAWTPAGSSGIVPYIVMEFVEGSPLGVYCVARKLAILERLQLFRQICDAVAYAHRQLIVHRDLKPANILVMPDGTPKLIDFGVAKSLASALRPDSALTATGALPLTPDYASPEQIRGEPVSTSTDVYALGTVLYELLTGNRPYRLPAHDPIEMARIICEQPVNPPRLGGDLDVIILKALQKHPERRYHSVDQLSEDVRRFQEGLPIVARPDSVPYRARKFARRHRLGLTAVAVIFLALAVAVVVSVWSMNQAATEAATAKAVVDFLRKDLLSQAAIGAQSEANAKPDPDLTVRTALNRAAATIGGRFEAQPLVEAAVRQTIGDAYGELGLYSEAAVQLERCVALRSRALRATHPDTLSALISLSSQYTQLGRYSEARVLLVKVVEARRRTQGARHHDTLTALSDLGELYSYEGDDVKAEPLLVEAVKGLRATLGVEHLDTMSAMSILGVVYRIENKYQQAEFLLTQVSNLRNRILGPEHPASLTTAYELAIVQQRLGKYTEAEVLLRKVLEAYRRLLGPAHPFTLTALSGLQGVYTLKKDYQKANDMQAELIEQRRTVLGELHPDTMAAISTMADLQRRRGNLQQADSLFTQLLQQRRQVLGKSHRDTIATLTSLGRVSLLEGKYDQAEPLLREAVGLYTEHNPDVWHRFMAESLLGESLVYRRNYTQAEPLLLRGYQGLVQHKRDIPTDLQFTIKEAADRLTALYEALGKRPPISMDVPEQ